MICVISDAHFGVDKADKIRQARFSDLLKGKIINCDVLVLLGDIFDFWVEYHYLIRRDYFDILCLLKEIAQEKRVYFVSGNHDFFRLKFFEEIGIKVNKYGFSLEINKHKIFFTHGDTLYLSGKLTRFILDNPLSNFLFRLVHPELGIFLAKSFSKLSRLRTGKMEPPDDMPGYISKQLKKYDVVITGHLHYPMIKLYQNKIYANPGEWIADFTYLILDNDYIALYQYPDVLIKKVEYCKINP